MSQEEFRRILTQPEPIKYGDVFEVSGELASKPIAPKDAATIQSAETRILGQTQKGGPAAVMESAAALNERRGVVSHDDMTDVAREKGIKVYEEDIGGRHVVTEAIGGEVLAQYGHPKQATLISPEVVPLDESKTITFGEALHAVAKSAGDKPVDESDAAAIQAAEIRATGHIAHGGIAAHARSVAGHNARTMLEERKIKLN